MKIFKNIAVVLLFPLTAIAALNIQVAATDQGWDRFLLQHAPTMHSALTHPWVFALASVAIGFLAGMSVEAIRRRFAPKRAFPVTVTRWGGIVWSQRAMVDENPLLDAPEFSIGPISFANVSDNRSVTIEIYLWIEQVRPDGKRVRNRIEGTGKDWRGRDKIGVNGISIDMVLPPDRTADEIIRSPLTLAPDETRRGFLYFLPHVGEGTPDNEEYWLELVDTRTLASTTINFGQGLVGGLG